MQPVSRSVSSIAREGTGIPTDTSLQIKVCRVIGISFMMYVHVNPGLDAYDVSSLGGTLAPIKLVLADVLGRASVPALSIISGYLIVAALRKYALHVLIRERFLTLMVPMIFWNALIVALSITVSLALGSSRGFAPGLNDLSVWQIVAFKLLSLNDDGVTVALKFLRDLFVCVLLASALLAGVKKAGWLFVSLVWILGLTVGFAPIVQRPHILMFFVLGVFAAHRYGHLSPSPRIALTLLATGIVLECTWRSGFKPSANIVDTIRRLEFSILMLFVSLQVARSRWCRPIIQLEPAIFFVFLGHTLFFLVLWGLWQPAFGRSLQPPYVVFFLSAPIVWLLTAMLLYPKLSAWPPWLQMLVKGKAGNRGGAADSQLIVPTAPAPLEQEPKR